VGVLCGLAFQSQLIIEDLSGKSLFGDKSQWKNKLGDWNESPLTRTHPLVWGNGGRMSERVEERRNGGRSKAEGNE